MSSFGEPRIVCRPALPSDTSDVLAFTKHIWEGRDYIHLVWDHWLGDPNGILISAQFGPKVVGIAKVTPVVPGQWWLHGLRVDPEYQGRKIGSHLHEYADRWWIENGDGTIRLLTSTERVQVHRLCSRTGYARVGEIAQYRYELGKHQVKSVPSESFRSVPSEDIPSALSFARQHSTHNAGLMDTGWRFVRPDEIVLGRFVEKVHLHWWRGRDGLLATWEDEDDDYTVLGIGFAAVRQPGMLADLLRETTSLTAGRAVGAVFWLAPADEEVQLALRRAGYSSDDDHGFLFEKQHPGK